VRTGTRPSAGTRSEATAAATRKIAGAGTRIRSLTRLDNTASSPAALMIAMTTPNGTTSFTADSDTAGRPGQGGRHRNLLKQLLPTSLPGAPSLTLATATASPTPTTPGKCVGRTLPRCLSVLAWTSGIDAGWDG